MKAYLEPNSRTKAYLEQNVPDARNGAERGIMVYILDAKFHFGEQLDATAHIFDFDGGMRGSYDVVICRGIAHIVGEGSCGVTLEMVRLRENYNTSSACRPRYRQVLLPCNRLFVCPDRLSLSLPLALDSNSGMCFLSLSWRNADNCVDLTHSPIRKRKRAESETMSSR